MINRIKRNKTEIAFVLIFSTSGLIIILSVLLAVVSVNANVNPVSYTVERDELIILCQGEPLQFRSVTEFRRDVTVVFNITIVELSTPQTVSNVTPLALKTGANWSSGERIPAYGWNDVSVPLSGIPNRDGAAMLDVLPVGSYEYRLAAIEMGGGNRSGFTVPFSVVSCD